MTNYQQFAIDRSESGMWTVTFSNPPINLLDPTTIRELQALVTEAETDQSVKVLLFQSADQDFFIAHFDTSKAAQIQPTAGPAGHHPWIDFVLRLSQVSAISIAKIRGRTRGIGNEFVLACDMRFASRQKAIFGNPEIGVGLPPGGGALEWLPRMVGRSRALEIVLSGDDFDADVAERYGWVNRTLDDGALDAFVDELAARLASFEREALGAIKSQINRAGVPNGEEMESSNRLFSAALSWPNAQSRRAKIHNLGYGVRSEFELNFGRFLPSLTPDHTDAPR
jgi:enoyl-CoA hydratase/carnithine racemase